MTDELPPFSGSEPTCEKCGYEFGASVRWLPQGHCLHSINGNLSTGDEPNERLHRECRRCGYMWDEAVNVEAAEAARRRLRTFTNRHADDA